jgi:hypothetical protein
MPPIMGAAIRFMVSAPAPIDHMIGISARKVVITVMNLGRSRWTAPSMMASRSSARVRSRPAFFALS